MALFIKQDESKRPTFITVVCIISFIVNGFSFVNNMAVFNDPAKEAAILQTEMQTQQASIQAAKADPATKDQLSQMLSSLTNTISTSMVKKMSLYSVVAAFICLMGTSLMWRLKKIRFPFLYRRYPYRCYISVHTIWRQRLIVIDRLDNESYLADIDQFICGQP